MCLTQILSKVKKNISVFQLVKIPNVLQIFSKVTRNMSVPQLMKIPNVLDPDIAKVKKKCINLYQMQLTIILSEATRRTATSKNLLYQP